MIHYSCIGATGYVCGEVLRMMVNHHEGELVNVLDTYGAGDAISTHHPALRGFYDQVIMDLTEENVRETAKKSDVIMIQVPSGDVAKWAEIVLAEDCAIIDIGADIRFRDVDVWEKWYGQKHPDAKMTHDAVYCIPEVMRDLAKGKKLIANPGCYPTASTLGLQPMLKAGHIVDNTIVIDAKSGYTGAGRRPALNKLLTEAENNFCAYALGGGHRHTPEIEQNIAYITGKDLMKPDTGSTSTSSRTSCPRFAVSRSPSTPPATETSPTRKFTSSTRTSTRMSPSSRSSRRACPFRPSGSTARTSAR